MFFYGEAGIRKQKCLRPSIEPREGLDPRPTPTEAPRGSDRRHTFNSRQGSAEPRFQVPPFGAGPRFRLLAVSTSRFRRFQVPRFGLHRRFQAPRSGRGLSSRFRLLAGELGSRFRVSAPHTGSAFWGRLPRPHLGSDQVPASAFRGRVEPCLELISMIRACTAKHLGYGSQNS